MYKLPGNPLSSSGAADGAAASRAPVALDASPFDSISSSLEQIARGATELLSALKMPAADVAAAAKRADGFANDALSGLNQAKDVELRTIVLESLEVDAATLARFDRERDIVVDEAIKRANALAAYASGDRVTSRVLMTTVHNFATALSKVTKALSRSVQELSTDRADASRVMYVTRRPMHPNAFTRRASRGGVHMSSRMSGGPSSSTDSSAVWLSLLPETEDRELRTLE